METFKNEQVNSTKIHQKQSNIPQIRFKGFNDAWEQRRLGEAFINLQNNTLSRAELSSGEGKVKNVHYGDLLVIFSEVLNVKKEELPTIKDESIISKYKESFLKNGDIVMADTAEDETVGKCTEIEGLTEEIVISGLHTIPYRPQSKFAPRYLGYYLNSAYYHDQLLPLTQGIKVSSISKTSLKSTYISYPKSLVEQGKIGNFFNYLDHLITLHQRKCDQLKNIKKSLLEKLFPKNGTLYPELRFKEFTDAWEQRKALNIAEYSKGNGYSKGDLKESGTPIILYGRLYTNYQFSIGEVDTFVSPKNDSIYSQGNEVIVPASGESAEDIARASAVEKSGVLLGGDLNVIRPFNFISSLFLAIAISNGEIQKELAKKAQGKSVVHIHNSDIQKLEISYPELEEQKQIGAIFLKIDNLITLHQRKVEKLKKVKASLLEKMFV